MVECVGLGSNVAVHILIWFPVAYIIVWGANVMIRRSKHGPHPLSEEPKDDEEEPFDSEATTTPFLEVPSGGGRESSSPRSAPPTKQHQLPGVHSTPCFSPWLNQAAVLSLVGLVSVLHLVVGIDTLITQTGLPHPTYSGALSLALFCVWTWCTAILVMAPASCSCSVPVFWTLNFYAEVVSMFLSGCGFWNLPTQLLRVSQGAIVSLEFCLVFLSWKQFLGLSLLPVLLFTLVCQCAVGLGTKLFKSCCPGKPPISRQQLGAPLVHNELQQVQDGETTVELLIYDLWPSWLPVYVGTYLGAYHTGIAAATRPGLDFALEYTFECPHGIVARRRGKKPSYVQGDTCTSIYLGKCSIQAFNDVVATLKASERYGDGERYGILSNNCHNFCDAVIAELQLPVRVPCYAQSLDQVVGFFIPGGSLQTLEQFVVSLEGPCETRTKQLSLLCCLGFVFCVVIPTSIIAVVQQ